MFIRQSDAELTEKWIQVPDAIGLGLFAALGAQIALIAGSSTIVAILMGVILSTLGGVLRDILCNVIPKVFTDHQPYVILAVLGSLIVIGLNHFGIVQWVALVVAIGVTTATRCLVLACNISIPIRRP